MPNTGRMKLRGCWVGIVLLAVPPLLIPFILKMEMGGTRDDVALTVAMVWLIVSVPVSILLFLDWFRSPSTGGLGRGLRNIARAPVFLFGAIAVLIGVGVLAWVAYNVLIVRQREFRWTSL